MTPIRRKPSAPILTELRSEVYTGWKNRFVKKETGLRKLRDYLARKIPDLKIADGESRFKLSQTMDSAGKGLLDVIQMDIEFLGLTKWHSIVVQLQDMGVTVSPHNRGFGLKTRYTASLGAGLPEVDLVEGVIDETEGVDTAAYGLFDGKWLFRSAEL